MSEDHVSEPHDFCEESQIEVWDQTVGCSGCGVAWWGEDDERFLDLHPWWEELPTLYDPRRYDVPQQIDLGGEA